MKKKTITKILILTVFIVLFTFNIKAEILATIGSIGGELALSFADPGIANTIKTVQTAAGIANPQTYITSKISGEVMGQIIQGLPKEAQQAIAQYNQVKGWVDKGAKISEDLKLDDKGGLAGGSIVLDDNEQELGQIINPDNKDLSIKATNMEVSTQGEGEDVSFIAKKDGYVEINGKRYNVKENSKMLLDRDGNIKETDSTFSEATQIELGGVKYDVPKNARIVYKNGIAEITTESGETVKINDQEIKIGKGSITYDGKKIVGKDFTVDDKRFSELSEGKLAEVTITDKGYLLGKNTKMEDDRITLTSEKGDVLYSKMCGDVSGFNNYINPCRKSLTMEGEGFSVQLGEGKQFGLDIGKEDILKYDMNGGKVILDNGEQRIFTQKEGGITITNGEVVTKYKEIDGVTQALVDPNTLGGEIDVSMTTKYDDGSLVTITDEKTDAERVYCCPASVTGAAVTGAFSLLEKCKSYLGLSTGNQLVGRELWDGEIISEESKLVPYETQGKKWYTKMITTERGGVEYKYSIASNGRVSKWNPEKLRWEEQDYTLDEQSLKSLGIPLAETVGASTQPAAPPPSPTSKVESAVEALEKMGSREFNRRRSNALSSGLCTENQYFVGPMDQSKNYMYLQPAPLKGIQGPIKDAGLLVQIIKDPATGKVIRYEGIDNPVVYKPVGSGKVEIVK